MSCSVLLAGCFNFEKTPLGASAGRTLKLQSTHETATEHVVVSNFGWYLFNRWPIVCGNAQEGRRTPWVFFRDDVNEHLLQRRLMKYAAERECNATDVNLFNNAEVLMSIGIGGVSLPVPYLISYRELQYSCSLVAKEKPNEDASKSGKPNEVSSESPKRDTKKLNEEMRRLLNNIPDGDEQ